MSDKLKNITNDIEFNKNLKEIDKEEFLKIVEWLKEKTNNFSVFPEEILEKNSQLLLVIRCLLGMKKKEFAENLGICEDTLWLVEAGKRRLRKETIEKIVEKLNSLFKEKEVNIEEAVRWFLINTFPDTQNPKIEEIRKELKQINLPDDLRKMDENQFEKVVSWLKEKTDNFKKFPEEIFLANNQLILILRCVLGMTRPTFAKKVGINVTTLRFIETKRQQNQITTFKIARKWCEKVNAFLSSLNEKVDESKSLTLWKEVKRHVEETPEEEIKLIRKELESLNFPSIKSMNEDDVEKLFLWMREKTNNFKEISLPLFLSNPSLIIFFLRCFTGLSQQDFSKTIGATKDFIRRVESGREKIIHAGPALRWLPKINEILNSKQTSLEEFKRNFEKIVFKKQEEVEKRKSFRELTKEEFLLKIKELKEKSNNFEEINKVLKEDARNLFLLRVLLKMRIKELARVLKIDRKEVKRWESGKRRMNPETREKIAKFFEEKLKNFSFDKNIVAKKFEEMNKIKTSLDPEPLIRNGLRIIENLPPTLLEEEIIEVLREKGLPFQLHATIECTIPINVDFAIPNKDAPRKIIEVSEMNTSRRNILNKIEIIDHRFQHIKRKDPAIQTIMIIKSDKFFNGERKEKVKDSLLNTDVLILGNSIEEIREEVKKSLEK
ncbi:MAG: helix-turn-helix domain-containing protein [Candidatus Aenigmatarchaeota archaeon]